MKLGELIKKKRMSLDMTLDDVALAAGVSKSHLHGIEQGKTEPSIVICARLSIALALPVQLMASAALLQSEKKRSEMEWLIAYLVVGVVTQYGVILCKHLLGSNWVVNVRTIVAVFFWPVTWLILFLTIIEEGGPTIWSSSRGRFPDWRK
jgi:transcriptional regulator with XRE-family HTH domain